MKRKIILFGSIFAVCILLVTGFSSTVYAIDINEAKSNVKDDEIPPWFLKYMEIRDGIANFIIDIFLYLSGVYIEDNEIQFKNPIFIYIAGVLVTLQIIRYVIWNSIMISNGWYP